MVYFTVTSQWALGRLNSPASELLAQPFVQSQIKENIKALHRWSLWGESIAGIPSQRASNTENVSIWWRHHNNSDVLGKHLMRYINVIITTMASQITSLTVVYSIVYSGADQRKHQNSASLAFVQGIHHWQHKNCVHLVKAAVGPSYGTIVTKNSRIVAASDQYRQLYKHTQVATYGPYS